MSIVCCLSQSAQQSRHVPSRIRAPIAPGNGARSNPSFSAPQRAHFTVAIRPMSTMCLPSFRNVASAEGIRTGGSGPPDNARPALRTRYIPRSHERAPDHAATAPPPRRALPQSVARIRRARTRQHPAVDDRPRAERNTRLSRARHAAECRRLMPGPAAVESRRMPHHLDRSLELPHSGRWPQRADRSGVLRAGFAGALRRTAPPGAAGTRARRTSADRPRAAIPRSLRPLRYRHDPRARAPFRVHGLVRAARPRTAAPRARRTVGDRVRLAWLRGASPRRARRVRSRAPFFRPLADAPPLDALVRVDVERRRAPRVFRGRLGVPSGLRDDRRARGSVRRGSHADRRIRSTLVHERGAHESRRSRRGVPRPALRASLASVGDGGDAFGYLPADRRAGGRAAAAGARRLGGGGGGAPGAPRLLGPPRGRDGGAAGSPPPGRKGGGFPPPAKIRSIAS